MLVCSRHWTLVQAKRYLKRWRNVDEAVARGLARRRCRVVGHRLCWRDVERCAGAQPTNNG